MAKIKETDNESLNKLAMALAEWDADTELECNAIFAKTGMADAIAYRNMRAEDKSILVELYEMLT
jgi:hypothetical protein